MTPFGVSRVEKNNNKKKKRRVNKGNNSFWAISLVSQVSSWVAHLSYFYCLYCCS